MNIATYPRGNCTPWRIKKPNAEFRLICLPYAGGSASFYRQWVELAPPWLDIIPYELPGRGIRLKQPLISRVSDLAKIVQVDLADELSEPFALFGHSFGAFLAYALAHDRKVCGKSSPQHLFLSGAAPPQSLEKTYTPIYDLPSELFFAELAKYGGTPKEILDQPDLMKISEPILRNDFRAASTYVIDRHVKIDTSLTTFSGTIDSFASPLEMKKWQEYSSAVSSHTVVEGGHFFPVDQREPILRQIQQVLFFKI